MLEGPSGVGPGGFPAGLVGPLAGREDLWLGTCTVLFAGHEPLELRFAHLRHLSSFLGSPLVSHFQGFSA